MDAVGKGPTGHNGDDVCGGSCVDVRRISRTIPAVQYLRGGSFFVPAQTLIGVKLLTA
jgi:hypothetical protein